MQGLTQRDLYQAVKYCPIDGLFTFRQRPDRSPQWNGRYAGRPCGSIAIRGSGIKYLTIYVGGQNRYAHRLAHLYMTGEMPDEVDHKDGDGLNNKWGNLRTASRSENLVNRKNKNRELPKGVSLCRRSGKYKAIIQFNNRKKFLGRFDGLLEAKAAYDAEAIKLHGAFRFEARS